MAVCLFLEETDNVGRSRRFLVRGTLAGLVSAVLLAPVAAAAPEHRVLIGVYRSPTDNPLATIVANGTGYREVTPGTADWGAGSPGGEGIAFADAQDIYLVGDDPDNPLQLTDADGGDLAPRWSPDGSHLVFLSARDGGDLDVYKMRSDGSREKALTAGDARETEASWAPDRPAVLFLSDRDGDFDVYKMRTDGSSVTKLTHNSTDEAAPRWSPDGGLISFTRYGPNNKSGLYVMRPDGTNKRRILRYEAWAEWSADSRLLTFHGDLDHAGDFEIYTVRADGTGLEQLTHNGTMDFDPYFSPTGHTIAFTTQINSSEVRTIAPNGDVTRLTRNRTPDVAIGWVTGVGS